MIGKRFFLIAGGTIGGIGAVLSITPPQFGATSGLTLGGGTSLSGGGTPLSGGTTSTPTATPTPTSTAATSTPTPATTKKPTKKPTKPPTKKPTSDGSTPSATKTTPPATHAPSTPTPTSTPQSSGVSGTFTGGYGNTRYGPVQVQITVVNNKITNAIALTYPTGSFRDQQINQQAIPYLIQETLAAQSANIQGVGGASYTSQGWVTSLQSALTKAGL